MSVYFAAMFESTGPHKTGSFIDGLVRSLHTCLPAFAELAYTYTLTDNRCTLYAVEMFLIISS